VASNFKHDLAIELLEADVSKIEENIDAAQHEIKLYETSLALKAPCLKQLAIRLASIKGAIDALKRVPNV
jgi:hypothetical protein